MAGKTDVHLGPSSRRRVVISALAIVLVSANFTLLVELSLAFLIWNRALRPYVIAFGLMLHAGIEVTVAVGFFSAAACTGYIAFLPEERADEVIAWMRRRLGRSRRPRLRALARAGEAPTQSAIGRRFSPPTAAARR